MFIPLLSIPLKLHSPHQRISMGSSSGTAAVWPALAGGSHKHGSPATEGCLKTAQKSALCRTLEDVNEQLAQLLRTVLHFCNMTFPENSRTAMQFNSI